MKYVLASACVSALCCVPLSSRAVPAPATDEPSQVLPGRPDKPAPEAELLGTPFESTSAGIGLSLPQGCVPVADIGADEIAVWSDKSRDWTVKLSRITFPRPMLLTESKDAKGNVVPGFLEITVTKLQQALPGAKILRQDVTDVQSAAGGKAPASTAEKANVGMIALRYTAGTRRRLTQQALIEANDQLYYILSLTTPGSTGQDDTAPEDPAERTAAKTFSAMIDSVKLLDRSQIKRDQDDRLYRTRTWFVNLSEKKLRSALVPEQWLRMMKDGKDVGYSYIVEESAGEIPRLSKKPAAAGETDDDRKRGVTVPEVRDGDGILVGVRSRMIGQAPPPRPTDAGARPAVQAEAGGPVQIDSESWFFVTNDRRHEEWSRVTRVNDGKTDPRKNNFVEYGSSDRKPWASSKDPYTLNVTHVSPTETPSPVTRPLPPFYLPQAVGQLLPRLLPLKQAKTYLFATYAEEAQEVMLRYVDVGEEKTVTLAGRTFRAIPISDRLGYAGSITTHYVSLEGQYMGSENKDSRLVVAPTDGPTLQKIWQDANLTRPREAEPPAPAVPAVPAPRPPTASDLINPGGAPK